MASGLLSDVELEEGEIKGGEAADEVEEPCMGTREVRGRREGGLVWTSTEGR